MIILFILFIISHAWEHAHDESVNHYRATFTRITVGAITFWAMFDYSWMGSIFNAFLILSMFWIVFDLTYNLLRGNHPLYIGGTSSIDKLGRRFTGPYYFMKLWCLVGSVGMWIQHYYA